MARKSSGSRSSSLGALGFTLVALILTGCTAFFLAQVLKGKNIEVVRKQPVVVAARNIKASIELKKEYFKVVKMPFDAIPENHYSNLGQLFPTGVISKPKVLVSNLYKNEVLSKNRISDPKRGTGFASMVAKNWRALCPFCGLQKQLSKNWRALRPFCGLKKQLSKNW